MQDSSSVPNHRKTSKTASHSIEDELRARIRELELVYQLSMDVARARSLDEIYSHALDAVLESLRADRASLLLFDDDDVIRFKAWSGLTASYRKAVEGHSPWARGEQSPSPITVPDVCDDPSMAPFRDAIVEEGIRALAFIPLVADDRLVGKFMAYCDEPRVFTDAEIRLVQTVANHVAFAIDHHIREAELQLLNESLEHRVRLRTAELTHVNEELRRRNEDLQNFANVASHDLQEPLRKICSFADLLRDDFGDQIDEMAKFYAERMQSSAVRMSHLLSDLLQYSRVSTQDRVFGRIDLNDVVAAVAADLQLQIEDAGATIKSGHLPVIECDQAQIRQLLWNLVSNALTYRTIDVPSIIEIDAEIQPRSAASNGREVCRLVVRDNGIGFDEKYTDRIFQPFQRLHRTEYPGSGMGLAICRRIAESHHGMIEVRSRPGAGSEFIVTLSCMPAADPIEVAATSGDGQFTSSA